jgi:hypothetical protein
MFLSLASGILSRLSCQVLLLNKTLLPSEHFKVPSAESCLPQPASDARTGSPGHVRSVSVLQDCCKTVTENRCVSRSLPV